MRGTESERAWDAIFKKEFRVGFIEKMVIKERLVGMRVSAMWIFGEREFRAEGQLALPLSSEEHPRS